MSNIEKPKFQVLDVSGSNYLEWCLEVKVHLRGMKLSSTILENENANDEDKANALILIRRHLDNSLRTQYLAIDDPLKLWVQLKKRYDHTKTVIEPLAKHEWQNLRLQDFKSVTEYNFALYDVVTRLELCGTRVSDAKLIEKTLSTFHASDLVLQRQYRQMGFTEYSELIAVLLSAEKHDQVLLKNHNLRPSGSKALPEANANMGPQRKRGRRGNERKGPNSRKAPTKQWHRSTGPTIDKGKKPIREDACHRCGKSGHWSRACRAPKHVVDAYKASQRTDKGKRVESHAIDDRKIEANAIRGSSESGKVMDVADFLNMD